MIKATNIKKGQVLKYEGKLYEVVKTEHITPGKGNAIMQVGVRDIESGKSKGLRFRSAETVEVVNFDSKKHQYLYNDGHLYSFMDMEDYQTIELGEDIIGDYKHFLIENMEIGIAFYEGRPIHVEFPRFITLKVTSAEPWIKGDSVSNNTKPVILETGYTIKVPLFVNEGDVIKIDTETGAYLERA